MLNIVCRSGLHSTKKICECLQRRASKPLGAQKGMSYVGEAEDQWAILAGGEEAKR